MLVHQHTFEGFGCDLQNARGIFQQFIFVRGGDIAVPMKDGNAAVTQERVDALKLVIDEAFQRRDIEDLDGL